MTLSSVAAGFAAGLLGGMGLGGGAVLLLYLTLFAGFEQLAAQGINLLFFLPIGVAAVAVYAKRGEIAWKTVGLLSLTGAAGSLLGAALVDRLGGRLTTRLFAVLLFCYGLHEIFARGKKQGLHPGGEHGILKSNKCSTEADRDGKNTAD